MNQRAAMAKFARHAVFYGVLIGLWSLLAALENLAAVYFPNSLGRLGFATRRFC